MARNAETTYRIMSAIKSKDTTPEKLLGKALWKLGLRYRKHYKLDGRPDFVFVSARLTVFCDGDFWHGNNWSLRGLGSLEEELATYNTFWADKIRRNVERDKRINLSLKEKGWLVLRFWESDIRKSPEVCAYSVNDAYRSQIRK